MQPGGATATATEPRAGSGWFADRYVMPLAVAGALLTLVANLRGIAIGEDGVGYRAIADSLLAGDGLGYFLERPLTIWPPVWPAAMAAVARFTPLDTVGAAVVLNAAMTVAAVIVAHRLFRRVVTDDRLVLLGTCVVALGSSTVGFGHLLMTDFAFGVVIVAWMLTLMRWRETRSLPLLIAAAAWVWMAFGLRYVAVALIGTGGVWLVADLGRPLVTRIRDAAVYGIASLAVPLGWMLRNRSIDGSFTGERYPSARGLVDNGFDILATLGRFLLPGVANGAVYLWAAIGGVGLVAAVVVAWRVLRTDAAAHDETPTQRVLVALGGPVGLVALHVGAYLTYMLYVRTTTALNQLDLRLLNPAYLGLVTLALVLVDRLRRVPDERWWRAGRATVHAWAVANVVAGVVGAVVFASGNPYFTGNYESDTFRQIREDPALQALPGECDEVVSNLPNALYPAVEARWSPRRTGLESNEPVPDLDEVVDRLDRTTMCLVWVDETPVYGHLWTREQLDERVQLTPVGGGGVVTVYRLDPR
jgi:hypothetical protein